MALSSRPSLAPMQVEQLRSAAGQLIDGPLLLTPRVFEDERGFFLETWNQQVFAELLGVTANEGPQFRQDNQSHSVRGVLRGLHYQLNPEPQGKLVRCTFGEVFDVAVDIRRNSASYGQWVGARLSATNHAQLWVPVGFAHGFLTISDAADVLYKASGYWNRGCERSLLWNDSELAINWPLDELGEQQVLLSEKDAAAPTLNEACKAGDLFT